MNSKLETKIKSNNILYRISNIKIVALVISIIVLMLDQYTKAIAVEYLIYTKPYPVLSLIGEKLNFGLNWFLTYNYGTAFSFIKTADNNTFIFLVMFSTLITIALLYWLYKEDSKNKVSIIAIGCIIGGALGNIYDRIALGYVVDFVDVYAGSWHWPVFNLADSAISVGVVLLLLTLLFGSESN